MFVTIIANIHTRMTVVRHLIVPEEEEEAWPWAGVVDPLRLTRWCKDS
jgi:hypothetical protein